MNSVKLIALTILCCSMRGLVEIIGPGGQSFKPYIADALQRSRKALLDLGNKLNYSPLKTEYPAFFITDKTVIEELKKNVYDLNNDYAAFYKSIEEVIKEDLDNHIDMIRSSETSSNPPSLSQAKKWIQDVVADVYKTNGFLGELTAAGTGWKIGHDTTTVIDTLKSLQVPDPNQYYKVIQGTFQPKFTVLINRLIICSNVLAGAAKIWKDAVLAVTDNNPFTYDEFFDNSIVLDNEKEVKFGAQLQASHTFDFSLNLSELTKRVSDNRKDLNLFFLQELLSYQKILSNMLELSVNKVTMRNRIVYVPVEKVEVSSNVAGVEKRTMINDAGYGNYIKYIKTRLVHSAGNLSILFPGKNRVYIIKDQQQYNQIIEAIDSQKRGGAFDNLNVDNIVIHADAGLNSKAVASNVSSKNVDYVLLLVFEDGAKSMLIFDPWYEPAAARILI